MDVYISFVLTLHDSCKQMSCHCHASNVNHFQISMETMLEHRETLPCLETSVVANKDFYPDTMCLNKTLSTARKHAKIHLKALVITIHPYTDKYIIISSKDFSLLLYTWDVAFTVFIFFYSFVSTVNNMECFFLQYWQFSG